MPRTAKSAALHLYEGNPNNLTKKELYKRQKNESKLKVSQANIDPPSWLNMTAKNEFKRITALMAETDVLTEADIGILALYCDTYADYLAYRRQIKANGMQSSGKLNVFIREKRNAAQLLDKLGSELGLSPGSRASLAIRMNDDSSGKADEHDEFD
ncbi:phage terminase small subunit P27 family [Furfurilactobacillus entadae]|uniref:phage terminase small subunit P27 family n=1 Tax=Furfurilactobacillus entadae TaxID=2922307 RepID=UPI0035E8B223